MKKITSFILLFLTSFIFAQTPCEGGFADGYPCNEVDLMSHISLATFGASAGTDSWGWTDPTTQKEYAIMGVNNGACFVDITDPTNPIYLGKLPTHTSSSIWRDIKIYNNYAFIVSEASNHGMQVFDLTRLRNVANPPETFTEDAHNDSFGHAHNIAINEDTGYAYIIGATPYSGGGIFINIQNPLSPVNEGGYADVGYSHDAQIIIYNGPDTEHQGKEIFLGFNENSVVIVDVTNKENPVTLSETVYANIGYTHQGWLDQDHTFLYVNDETDEQNFGFNTRSIVFDASDLDNPVFKMEYFGTTTAIDHNYYSKDDKLYLANYRAGLRILDISDVANNNMSEIGYFDTFPSSDSANFNGAWNVYPFFESGNILISDIESGLFVVRNEPLQVYNLDASVKFANDALACGENSLSPKIQVKNVGLTTLTSLDITYTLPGESPINFSWTGSLNQNETEDITLGAITLSSGSNVFQVNCTNPNNGTDENPTNDSNISNLVIQESFDTTQVHLELLSDDYGNEITWEFKDSSNTVLYSGGPYSNNTVYNEVFNVSLGQCYTFEINDSFGDGICCNEGDGFYTLTTDDNSVIVTGGDYGSGETSEMSINETVIGLNDNMINNISIYPNPTKNSIKIQSNELIINKIEIFDILGKKINDYQFNISNPSINIENLNNGIYFLKINDNSKTFKIIKQ